MDSVARLLLRILVVPLGIVAAVCIAVLVVVVTQWHAFIDAVAAQPGREGSYFFALVLFGPWIGMVMAGSTLLMLTPGLIGIIIAEAFALRSWLFHLANGVIGTWVGWSLVDQPGDSTKLFPDPTLIVVVGLCAGFTYWLVAGWSAGFFRPVFGGSARAPAVPPPSPPRPPAA